MTRALIGQEIQNGFVRGAAVGAISGAVFSLEIFAKRVEKRRGKRKEMSPKDAALAIQMSFRAYIIRRSQALRALRELAIFKTKLKEVQVLSLSSESDFFSIISTSLQLGVLLGRPLSAARRRTFDMPDAVIQKELAAGVAQVVRILDESNTAETLEGCARVLPQEKEKRVENGSDTAALTSNGGVEKFVRRYGCRAMMLETVAAVPGIVEAIPLITGACLRTLLSEILLWLLRMMRLITVMSTTLHLTFISRDNN
ncbi:NEP1-interacting protein 2 [Capsicum chinense]|nr:NEP1-interacting protein 2 [Capsicum chinense]